MSTPHHPQSNGHAESAVKKVKYLILKTAPTGNIDNEAFDRGLLELHNTPNFIRRSPAQILFGHSLRSCVPVHAKSFTKKWQSRAESCDCRANKHAKNVETRYNKHARALPTLKIGTQVHNPTSKRWDKVGIIMGIGKSRDYHIKMSSCHTLWRNRRFLRPVCFPPSEPPDADDFDTPSKPPEPRRSKRIKMSVQDLR
ncbi:uncharacterized protein LOC122254225 [Penaeus japonicus]|uniref:uncharacterized protein LOC122254221 n=1 Tax=Penaeus japonicus TaxID=27405 RepID=UPI001C715920|nr:uncharacterized protein LOC122254221 [Penaeus japonicus]XP_042873742.1 uncharacterized protein LOC122254225 [Penaeus japonicus]